MEQTNHHEEEDDTRAQAVQRWADYTSPGLERQLGLQLGNKGGGSYSPAREFMRWSSRDVDQALASTIIKDDRERALYCRCAQDAMMMEFNYVDSNRIVFGIRPALALAIGGVARQQGLSAITGQRSIFQRMGDAAGGLGKAVGFGRNKSSQNGQTNLGVY